MPNQSSLSTYIIRKIAVDKQSEYNYRSQAISLNKRDSDTRQVSLLWVYLVYDESPTRDGPGSSLREP